MSGIDILGIFAHPDDAELCAGGTFLKEIQSGKTAAIVDLTRGELGTRGTADIRKKEAQEGAALLGVSSRDNLGLSDGFFTATESAILAVVERIRHYKPTLVITNTLYDRHPDHAKAADLVKQAAFLSGLVKIETRDRENKAQQSPWRPERLFYTIQAYDQKPDIIVDISTTFHQKIAAMQAFQTQFFVGEKSKSGSQTFISTPTFLQFVEGRARDFGTQVGVEYGEGFVCETIPSPASLFDV